MRSITVARSLTAIAALCALSGIVSFSVWAATDWKIRDSHSSDGFIGMMAYALAQLYYDKARREKEEGT